MDKEKLLFLGAFLAICVGFNVAQNCTLNCHEYATCVTTSNASQCICNSGYTGNGTQCHALPCHTNGTSLCHGNAICMNNNNNSNNNNIHTCVCNPGFTGNGTSCSNINECQTTMPCSSNATCFDTVGSYTCQCNAGYSGNGSTCTYYGRCQLEMPCNYCKGMTCPLLSTCRSIADRSVCKCKIGYILSSGACFRAKRIFTIDNLVLRRNFVPNYAKDTTSAFATISTEIEQSLEQAFKSSIATASGFGAIQVTKLRKGSVVVSLNVLYVNQTSVTTKQIESLLRNTSLFTSLNLDVSKTPAILVSNLCVIGAHDCIENSHCIPTNDNTDFTCKCNADHELRDGICKRKRKLRVEFLVIQNILVSSKQRESPSVLETFKTHSLLYLILQGKKEGRLNVNERTYIEIIVPCVIVGFLLIFFICFVIVLVQKRRKVKQHQTHEIHIEHGALGSRGEDHHGVELKDVRDIKEK
eukprot:gene11276-12456_t